MKLDHDDMSVALTVEQSDDEVTLRLYGDGEQLGAFDALTPDNPFAAAASFAGYDGNISDLPHDEEVVLWSQGPDAIDSIDYCRECAETVDDGEAHPTHVSPDDYFHIEVKA